MLRLESLTLTNVRSFNGEHTIDFANRDKLIQVNGIIENTGGSSGAGKTSVFLALDYLLGINDIPATVLQSWLTKEPMKVIGVFKDNDKPLIITRSKATGLIIKTEEEIISGNSKIAEEKLDEIIGIPRKVFKKMIHKKQGDTGFFLNMTAKEIYEFLINILDLQPYMEKSNNIINNIKSNSEKLEQIQSDITTQTSSIEDLSKIKESKSPPTPTTTKEEIVLLQNKLAVIINEINSLNKQKLKHLNEIQKPEKLTIEFNDSTFKDLTTKYNLLNLQLDYVQTKFNSNQQELTKITIAESKILDLKNNINKLTEDKKEINNSLCPTCKQSWVGQTAQQKINEIDIEYQSYMSKILSFKDLILRKDKLLSDNNKLTQDKQTLTIEINNISAQITEEKIKQSNHNNELEKQYLQNMEKYRQECSEIEKQYASKTLEKQSIEKTISVELNEKILSFKLYENNIYQYNKEINEIDLLIKQKQENLTNLTSKENILNKQVLIATETNRLIKTYMLQTFQETLDLIGETATSILAGIPNTSNSTIYFEGCKENKDGSLKDEVTMIINKDGVDSVPVKALCGGESTAANLAVDLAVIDTIETKKNKGANFFIMDEPFNGLDAICKEQCLQILNQFDTNKKIIIVDHSSELKEMVSDVITIIKTGESSSIR